MNRLILIILSLGLSLAARAQEVKEIDIIPGEKWWGGASGLGEKMPFSEIDADLRWQNFNSQTTPLLVSSKGRYVWCDGPFRFQVKDGKLNVDAARGTVELASAGSTLRDAYLAASRKHFAPDGKLPPAIFFSKPQYNTWIELMYDQNQAEIIEYARGIVSNGFPAGILMIDDNWQKDYGNFEFRPDRFPDPKGMVDELHAMGFKVMLWISPFVSADSEEYRDLMRKGYLTKRKGSGLPAIHDWWNGASACYDLSNPEAGAHLRDILKKMQRDYGIDGFKFDAGDPDQYQQEKIEVFDGKSYDDDQTLLWSRFGLDFPYNEFRASWKAGGLPLVQRLGDKKYSWEGVASLVPSVIASGLLGYAYTCPDMIGGGEYSSFLGVDPNEFDQSLIVRSCQIHSMMPMMQFSVAPWRILDKENLETCVKYAKWHERLGDYILSQARNAAATGEPIVRHMEYSFPGQGFEECNDQYMLGDRYLVAPVMSAENTRTVKLPEGGWRDDEGKVYKGGKTYTIEVPLSRLPWFEPIDRKVSETKHTAFLPAQTWTDTEGKIINAHGAGLLYHKGKYYMYGEHKNQSGLALDGVHCYSSTDLYNWKDEGLALKVDPDGSGSDIESGCILERPKVIYNTKTDKYVMWFHLEIKGQAYIAARYGVAIADNPVGPFKFLRSGRVNPGKWALDINDWQKEQDWSNPVFWEVDTDLYIESIRQGMLFKRDFYGGQMARDQTVFVDDDGKAYHIYASEENYTLQIAELTDDYTAHTGKYSRAFAGRSMEAPAIFKKDGKYYLMMSGCSGWAPNAARTAVADNIFGPWKELGNPCSGEGAELTYRSQSTYILKLQETKDIKLGGRELYIYVGDRWNPDDLIDSRYIWLPIRFEGNRFLVDWTGEWKY